MEWGMFCCLSSFRDAALTASLFFSFFFLSLFLSFFFPFSFFLSFFSFFFLSFFFFSSFLTYLSLSLHFEFFVFIIYQHIQSLLNSFHERGTLFDCILLVLKFIICFCSTYKYVFYLISPSIAQGPVEDQFLTEQTTLYKDLK